MLKHLVESQQLNPEILFWLFRRADQISVSPGIFSEDLKGKVMATLFYEPSTRTRLSFESAMLKLGGKVLSTENAKEFSSTVKGESLEDTIRTVASYADCVVMRHFEEGSAKKASEISSVPVINAGDGAGQHPTQALLDIYTVYRELGRLHDLKIAMVGDLASGRTVRSLCYLLGKFEDNNIEIIFVSPDNLRMKDDIKEYLKKHKISFKEELDLDKILPEVDVVYVTRTQKERLSKEDYEKAKDAFVFDVDRLNLMKKEARVLHPLPHVGEISLPVELEKKDERIAYFRQVQNGLYMRMALLTLLLR